MVKRLFGNWYTAILFHLVLMIAIIEVWRLVYQLQALYPKTIKLAAALYLAWWVFKLCRAVYAAYMIVKEDINNGTN